MSKKYIVVKIKGGLGNQLFQYAFAVYLKKVFNTEVKLDYLSCYGTTDRLCLDRLKMFNTTINEASSKEIRNNCLFFNKYPISTKKYRITAFMSMLFDRNYYFEKNRAYRDVCKMRRYDYYDGYWQSWRFPYLVRSVLMNDLKPSFQVSEQTKNTIAKVSSENSVFIGIRKGDYFSSRNSRKLYGSFSIDYYLNSVKKICELVENPVFYVFSDDIEWCKSTINWGYDKVIYREKEDQTSDFEELLIMSSCKHAIIANSTFHWWGAFMIKNENKIVIAPNEWFANETPIDIIPPDWIKMKRNGEFKK